MKKWLTTFLVLLSLPLLSLAQSTGGSNPVVQSVVNGTKSLSAVPSNTVSTLRPFVHAVASHAGASAPTQVASPTTVALSYYDPNGQTVFNWQLPYQYGTSFINILIFQRFTLPSNQGFLDSISVYIGSISGGQVLLRVIPADLVAQTGTSFYYPIRFGLEPAIDSVMIDASQLKTGTFNTIKLKGNVVPKEFFVSIEPTISGGNLNTIVARGDSHTQPRRSTQESRVVMYNQTSTGIVLQILDSLLVNQNQQPVYSHLFMKAYVDTAASSPLPKIVTTAKTKAYAGQPYLYAAHASGVPRPTYALVSGPSGMTMDPATGEVMWSPSVIDKGDHPVTLRAANPNGQDEQSYTLSVVDASAPKITSIPKRKALVNEPYFYQVNATGGPEPTFTVSTTIQGLTIDKQTGMLTMTPQAGQVGSSIVGVTASNALGFDTQTFILEIETTASKPTITSTAKIAGKVGEEYSYSVAASGNPQPTYTLTTSPPGMVIGNQTGIITWTPSAEGVYDVTVHAENRVGSDDQSYKLTVAAGASLPVFTSTPVTTAIADQAYSYTVVASGNPTPTYQLISKPDNMAINEITGVVTWTPARTDRGFYMIKVRATNPAGSSDQDYQLHVKAIPRITSSEVFTAKVGVEYQYKVIAESEPACEFALTEKPAGMSIVDVTGLITWVPTAGQVGQHRVTVVATNDIGSAEQPYTIDVTGNTAVGPIASLNGFELSQNYPNPVVRSSFSPAITIGYVLPQVANVVIEIRNLYGEVVTTLLNERREPGSHQVVVAHQQYSALAAGSYFIILRSQNILLTRIMTIVK